MRRQCAMLNHPSPHGRESYLQRKSGKARAQTVQQVIHDLLHQREQVIDDDLESQQQVAQRACQWAKDAEGRAYSIIISMYFSCTQTFWGVLLKPRSATSVLAIPSISLKSVVRAVWSAS